MKILECSVCGHIEFDVAPDKCLVCRSMQSYKENTAAIKRPGQTPGGEADKKHLPFIKVEADSFFAGSTDSVLVKGVIGEMEHPMKDEHFIRWLDFYLDRKFVNRVWLSPVTNRPAAALSIRAKRGTITVCQNCNLHGTWMTEQSFGA
jgi:desulfoferrodoxin-like iron-binding protein